MSFFFSSSNNKEFQEVEDVDGMMMSLYPDLNTLEKRCYDSLFSNNNNNDLDNLSALRISKLLGKIIGYY